MADTEQPRKTYRGNCHCGAFVYEIESPEITTVGHCNCAICTKKGYLEHFPGPENFKLVKGNEDDLTTYSFGPKKLAHKFCPNCGMSVVMRVLTDDFPEHLRLGINAHTLQGLSAFELEKNPPHNGKSWGEPHKAPEHKGPLPEQIEGGKLHTGSCHCGRLTLAVMSKPLDETYDEKVVECNCSACERGGYMWIYPNAEQVVLSGSDEDLAAYHFARNIVGKTFCRTCGVHMTNRFRQPSEDELSRMSEYDKKWIPAVKKVHSVNARVLDDVDIDVLAKKVTRMPGRDVPPVYVNP